MPDRPSYHTFPGFCELKVDFYFVAEFDLFPERTFLPEENGTNPVLFEFLFRNAMFNKKAHSDICTKIVIL
jgi:hypothetical protein